MAKDKPEEITRRDFIGVAIGSALVAGIGCSDTTPAGSEGGASGGATGKTSSGEQGGETAANSGSKTQTGGATSANTKTGNGGSSSAKTSATSGGEPGETGGASGAEGGASSGPNTAKGGSTEGGSSAQGGASSGKGGRSSGKGGSSAKGGATNDSTTGQGGSSGKGGSSASGGTSSSSSSTPAGGTPLVAMVRGTDWAQATEDAIEKIGGLPDLTGKTVVIRPNVIDSKPDGTTNPEVIRGVIRAVKKKGATQILVAEDGFGGAVIGFMDTLGIGAVCKEEGATATELKNSPSTNAKPAQAAAWSAGIDFYNTVKNADYVINVPKCKTHGLATISMALKAWFGSIKRPSSTELHSSVQAKAAEAHLVRQEDLVVLDATRCMTTGGPSAGTMKDSKIVVASKDAIAADVTGVAIIRYNGGLTSNPPWDIGQIKRALALKFPGWLSAKADFPYEAVGISEHAEIMAKRN
ncbi:MAG TPA: DUF362 domain-containing protein [Polyangiaceae bacterium]|nr:DUF362 domain-containing protein [Polyangiaceae bacterium]